MQEPLRFVLAGSPVDHSLSPLMHAAALEIAGLDGTYEVVEANRSTLETLVAELRRGVLAGINATMPLKTAAFELADVATPEANASNSVNTLRLRDGAVEGHSTDVVATSAALGRFRADVPILVMGAGGAAAAVLAGAEGHPAYVSARRSERAAELVDRFDHAVVVGWGSGVAGAVVVNTTPLGMNSERLPSAPLEVSVGLIDLAYGPVPTPSGAVVAARGLPVVDGVEFLSEAAAASFTWWTGVAVQSATLAEAARKV